MSGFTSSCNLQGPLDALKLYFPALDPTTMSPNQCIEQCKNANWQKAVVVDGGICTCISDTGSMTSAVNELCDMPCTGNRQKKCGGIGNHVYMVASASGAPSVVCNIPSTVTPFTKIEIDITATKLSHNPTAYLMDAGDGTIVMNHNNKFAFSFINTKNKTISPKVQFQNSETGEYVIVPCSNAITSTVTTKDLAISCPPCAAVNKEIKCNITYSQSQDDSVLLNSDGTVSTLPLKGIVETSLFIKKLLLLMLLPL